MQLKWDEAYPGCGVKHYNWFTSVGKVTASLWYPSEPGGKKARYLGVLQGEAGIQAKPSGKDWPLVLVSHGSGGSRFDQFFLCERLAKAGYAVLAVDHKDRQEDARWQCLLRRPARLLAAWYQLKREAFCLSHIDFGSLSLIGHSAGAYDLVVAAGGQPEFAREPVLSPVQSKLAGFCAEDYALPDITHMVLLAPALSNVFSPHTLAAIRLPVLVVEAQDEKVNLLGCAADYATGLEQAQYQLLEGAGHYAFVYECPPVMRALNPDIAGGDRRPRAQLHQQWLGWVDAFFLSSGYIRTANFQREAVYV